MHERYRGRAEKLASLGPGGANPAIVPARKRPLPADAADAQPTPPKRAAARSRTSARSRPTRTAMPEQAAERRVTNFDEVALGYSLEMALAEADRCLSARSPGASRAAR